MDGASVIEGSDANPTMLTPSSIRNSGRSAHT
jgi:hypothetical protein